MIEKMKGSAVALLIGAFGGSGVTSLVLKQGKVEPTYHVHGVDFRREPGADGGVTVTAFGTIRLPLADGGIDVTDLGPRPCTEKFAAKTAVELMNAAAECLP